MRLSTTSAAILAFASLALLAGCTASEAPAPEPSAPLSEETPAVERTEEDAGQAEEPGDVLAACETFNALAERLGSADESVDDVFLDIYTDANAAADIAPEEARGGLIALGLVALGRDSGEVPQEDRDIYVEQALQLTAVCAEEGVQIVF